ncbi:Synaptojanin-1 [Manis pentadactyla]|nr:Synaptojanin-1 [Manis pentadactyla]
MVIKRRSVMMLRKWPCCFTSLPDNRWLCAGHWLHRQAFPLASSSGGIGSPPSPGSFSEEIQAEKQHKV